MNIKDIVIEYINFYENNAPIFIEDIREYVLKNIDDNNLSYEKIIKFARITNNKKAMKFLIENAR